MQLHLRKLDIAAISDDKVIVLIGKRDTGKSFLVKDLMYHHRDMPVGTVVSPTETANKFFGHFVPPIFIHDEYTQLAIENVVKRQELMLERMDHEAAVYGTSSIDPRAFLILDDCLYDAQSWTKDKNIRKIFMNGRHYKLMFVLTMQHPLGIPPLLRTNIDYVFILRENIVSNRKRIYDNYAGMFPSFDTFCQVMDQCTENFECLVIHNNAKSNRIEDQVFWYKAEQHADFKISSRENWVLSKECAAAAKRQGATEDTFDPNAAKPKKGPLISVKKSMY